MFKFRVVAATFTLTLAQAVEGCRIYIRSQEPPEERPLPEPPTGDPEEERWSEIFADFAHSIKPDPKVLAEQAERCERISLLLERLSSVEAAEIEVEGLEGWLIAEPTIKTGFFLTVHCPECQCDFAPTGLRRPQSWRSFGVGGWRLDCPSGHTLYAVADRLYSGLE